MIVVSKTPADFEPFALPYDDHPLTCLYRDIAAQLTL